MHSAKTLPCKVSPSISATARKAAKIRSLLTPAKLPCRFLPLTPVELSRLTVPLTSVKLSRPSVLLTSVKLPHLSFPLTPIEPLRPPPRLSPARRHALGEGGKPDSASFRPCLEFICVEACRSIFPFFIKKCLSFLITCRLAQNAPAVFLGNLLPCCGCSFAASRSSPDGFSHLRTHPRLILSPSHTPSIDSITLVCSLSNLLARPSYTP